MDIRQNIRLELYYWLRRSGGKDLEALRAVCAKAADNGCSDALLGYVAPLGWRTPDPAKPADWDWTNLKSTASFILRESRHAALKILLEDGKIDPLLILGALKDGQPGEPLSMDEACKKALDLHQKKGYKPANFTSVSLGAFLDALRDKDPAEYGRAMNEACAEYAVNRVWAEREGLSGPSESEAVKKLWGPLEHLRKAKLLGAAKSLHAACKQKVGLARAKAFDAPDYELDKAENYRKSALYRALVLDDEEVFMALSPLCAADTAEKLTGKVAFSDLDFPPLTWLAHALRLKSANCARRMLDIGANPWSACAEYPVKLIPAHLRDAVPNPIAAGAVLLETLAAAGAKSLRKDAGLVGADEPGKFAASLFEACKRDADLMQPGSGRQALANALEQAKKSPVWAKCPLGSKILEALGEQWELGSHIGAEEAGQGAQPDAEAPALQAPKRRL